MSADTAKLEKNLFWWFYQPYKWLIFIPLAVLLTFITFILVIVALPVIGAFRTNRYIPPLWARLLVWMTPANFSVEGLEHIGGRQAHIIVANHQSQYDILGLYGWLPLDFKWVLKEELRKIPLIGWGCAALGFVFVKRNKPELARKAVNAAAAGLEPGQGLLFFPEGTRSMGLTLLPFKKGAFRLAIDQQLPILPVTLVNTDRILPNKSLDLRPGRARMIIHRPVDIKGMSFDDQSALIRQVRDTIEGPLLAERTPK